MQTAFAAVPSEEMPSKSLSQMEAFFTGLDTFGSDLMTQRQFKVLLAVYMAPEMPTVRGLAQKLGVSKPVITRALTTLSQKKYGYVVRTPDPKDRRSVLIATTAEGQRWVEQASNLWDKNLHH